MMRGKRLFVTEEIPGRGPRTALAGCLLVAAMFLACSPGAAKTSPDEQGIRSAVEAYLRQEKGMDPSAMNMEILELEIAGGKARTRVRFTSPRASQALTFEYQLQRSGNGWAVASGHGSHGMGPGA